MIRPLVYICHPLASGPAPTAEENWEANIAEARLYAERLAREGFAPVAPYLTLYGVLHEPEDRDIGLEIDEAAISRCDLLLVCGDRVSVGMKADIEAARLQGVVVMQIAGLDDVTSTLLSVARAAQAARVART